jgi:regulator of protease activity HflC (stomatin/prohibitin superfamily)
VITVIGTGPQEMLAGSTALAWAVTTGLLVAVFTVCAFRVVGEGERLVVFRLGRLAVVKGPGLVVVVPVVDRGVRVRLGTDYVDLLWLEADTRDGVTVTVNGAALATVRDPVAYVRHTEPVSATVAAAEAEIRGYVGERDLPELVEPSETDRRELSARISSRTRAWGVEVTLVEFSRVQIRLKEDLIRWAEGFADRARRVGQAS